MLGQCISNDTLDVSHLICTGFVSYLGNYTSFTLSALLRREHTIFIIQGMNTMNEQGKWCDLQIVKKWWQGGWQKPVTGPDGGFRSV